MKKTHTFHKLEIGESYTLPTLTLWRKAQRAAYASAKSSGKVFHTSFDPLRNEGTITRLPDRAKTTEERDAELKNRQALIGSKLRKHAFYDLEVGEKMKTNPSAFFSIRQQAYTHGRKTGKRFASWRDDAGNGVIARTK